MRYIIILFGGIFFSIACATTKIASSEKLGYTDGSTQGKTTSSHRIIPAYKKEVVKAVVDRMIEAKGNRSALPPAVVIKDSKRYVAWMNKNEVGIEETAYDVCATYQADSLNCLAALIGHELTHYYQNHQVERQFEFSYLNRNTSPNAELSIHTRKEAEADYLGGFIAYSAGYYPFGILEKFLPKIYQVYNLKENISGYPPLAERIKNAKKSSTKANNLAQVFKTANYFVALEKYEDAIIAYEYILAQNYTSREIHNNIGVCYFMMAVHQWSDKIKYTYPIEVDGVGRLLGGAKGNGKDQPEALLEKAIEKFKIAQELDKTFATASLNQACAWSLLGNLRKATFFMEEAMDLATEYQQDKVLTDCSILRGIIATQEGEKDKATKQFQKAIDKGSILAAFNKDILVNGIAKVVDKVEMKGTSIAKEEIGNQNLDLLIRNSTPDATLKISRNFKLFTSKLSNSDLLFFTPPSNPKKIFAIQEVAPNYAGKSLKGIEVGSTKKELLEKYGTPERVVSQRQRELLVYPSSTIIFTLLNGKVQSWAVYRIK